MHHLVRTRSQHFVHSPRRLQSPLKVRHTSALSRQPIKKRRLGSTPFTAVTNAIDISSDEENQHGNGSPAAEGSRRRSIVPLSSEVGEQTVNKGRSKATARRRDASRKGKEKEVFVDVRRATSIRADVFDSEGESSPRKRKRSDEESDSADDTGSWSEMDEDEAEPEFIAESDQHLIDEAPAYALHRLRKAELIRLWKVAGMWTAEEGDEAESLGAEDEEASGISKKDLVDGLIAARKSSSGVSPSGENHSLGPPANVIGIRSDPSSARESSPTSSSEEDERFAPLDTDATPRAVPRTRSKLRARIDGASKSVKRSSTGWAFREKVFRGRSKSMGREKEDRKARFGDEVKSPAHGLFTRHTRRSSMSSSNYTTTDTSNPSTPLPRQTPRRVRRQNTSRSHTPGRRQLTKSRKASAQTAPQEDATMEDTESGSDSGSNDDVQQTPLVQRLRPRTRSSLLLEERNSEAEADGDDDDDDGDVESAASPGPSARLRSRDRLIDSDASLSVPRQLPDREAKLKAKEALKDDDDSEEMELDEEADEAVDEDINEDGESDGEDEDMPQISSGSPSPAPVAAKRRTGRKSGFTVKDSSDEGTASPTSEDLAPSSPAGASGDGTPDDDGKGEIARTTRSGKAFGVWQSRRRKLRQEAIDDPDMEVEDEEEEDEEEESDEAEEDPFEPDIDLSTATVASLTRLLRDELVQMCEARGIEVGGTKPQLAKSLLAWRDEQIADERSATSSQATAKPSSSSKSKRRKANGSGKIIHAVASNVHVSGKTTPVLLRDHVHAHDPATPHEEQHSEDSKKTGEAELNLDLQELGLEDSVIRPDLLQKLERIGSGGFKDVYIGKYRGRKVAISEFREHLSEMDIRELKLLAEFSHPNIVKFRGICIPEESTHVPCMLVSELCENGDLFDYIRNVPTPPLKRLLGLMLDIAKGLEYLHTHKPPIIHRDCKSSNILINRAGQAKVGDFGLARVKTSTRSMIRSLVGTVNWQAPELWHPNPRYDYKVDVFSAALVYWEMMSGWTGEKKYPWEGHNEHYIYDAVGAKHRRPPLTGLRKHWGNEPVALMERMWHQDPGERPTMTDVVTDLEVLYAAAPKA